MKFKLGDEVKVLKANGLPAYEGRRGTVHTITQPPWPYEVNAFGPGITPQPFNARELELVKKKAKKNGGK